MNDKPANRHRDLLSLIRDDATPNYLEFPTFDESKDFDPVPAVQGEPVYLYRRLGLNDFVTCDFTRYTELSGKLHLFETKVLYTAPQPADDGLFAAVEVVADRLAADRVYERWQAVEDLRDALDAYYRGGE